MARMTTIGVATAVVASVLAVPGWHDNLGASLTAQPVQHSVSRHLSGASSRVAVHDRRPPAPASSSTVALDDVLARYCVRCHNDRRLVGNLSLEGFETARAPAAAETAERMIRKLRAGMMPPPGARRPAGDTLTALAHFLEESIDEAAAAHPRPGSRPFQRLNRAEYARVVRDAFGLTVDPAAWLPEDEISAGFDNVADAQGLSPTLMDAYLTAASEVARRAVGHADAAPSSVTYTNPPSVSQHEWERVEGAPYGTRGGISVLHSFPADGEYVFSMSFMSG